MCDRNYEASDYINSYGKFTKIINKINYEKLNKEDD